MLALLMLACSGIKVADTAARNTGEPRPSVLVISIDTTRKDYLGYYGGPAETPNIDALMGAAMVMENHLSCSNWTFASVLCVQSGMSDVEAGYVVGEPTASDRIPGDMRMAEEWLSSYGYASRLVSGNTFFSRDNGVAQGFGDVFRENNGSATLLTDKALEYLDDLVHGDQPWYLQVHYMDPHSPYDPPEQYLGGLEGLDPIDYDLTTSAGHKNLTDDWDKLDPGEKALIIQHVEVRYAAELSYVDDQIGRLLDAVDTLGLTDKLAVVFWTDHGEQINDHGDFGHSYSLFSEENASAFAIKAPGLEPGSWTGPTSHRDIWPTILDVLGLPEAATFTGGPAWTLPEGLERYALRYHEEDSYQFVEQEGLKLLLDWASGERSVYDLLRDPEELHPKPFDASEPEHARLWALMEAEIARIEAVKPGVAPALR
jgi:arylsulfatase A-like enzyme